VADPHTGLLGTLPEVSYKDQPLEEFLDRLASDEPAPGGGSGAAVTAAMAAGLVAMAARLSAGRTDDADGIVETADGIRRRALTLADEDAAAYGRVLAAYRRPRDEDPDGRKGEIRVALEAASAVPLEVAGLAAEAAVLGARLVEAGNPTLEGDAHAAVELGRAAARAAARLVEINVRQGDLGGDWCERAAAHVARAERLTPGVFDPHTSHREV
jgi:methenyltetrahydrofolate cyclohydrolase